MKFANPKLKQFELAYQLAYSSSILQTYRNDINMLAPYRIQPKITNKRTRKLQKHTLIKIHMANMTPKIPK